MKRFNTHLDRLMHENQIKNDRELSEKLGLSAQNLSYRLRGNLTMDTVEKLAEFFKVTVKDFLI